MNKVLVAGSSGFIGSRLVRSLVESGVQVRGLSRSTRLTGDWASSVEQVEADISQQESLVDVARGCDTVFHCAGYAHVRFPRDISDSAQHGGITVDGTRFLLSEAERAGVKRFVFLSSVKATGEDSTHCLSEDDSAGFIDGYGSSRREAEHLVLDIGNDAGMHVCNLRPALVYGPGVKGNLLRMIAAIDRGRFPGIPDTGNDRSMIHVDDLVKALMSVVMEPKANGRTYHVTDGRHYSTRQVYEWMCEALGRPRSPFILPECLFRSVGKIGDVGEKLIGRCMSLTSASVSRLLDSACYSNDRLCNDIGFEPRYDLESSLAAMVQAWREGDSG
ncbi:MAG TPA: NAD-dependent epimerase/dehydratase family protein [Chromatiales bacterium]|nr:NAD-dependent epimerase/dehydratase family protein [Chromatiales bacterium]